MRHTKLKCTTASAITFLSLAGTSGWATSSSAQDAPIVPKNEVVTLYSDQTWKWSNGAGYFAPDGRFLAWYRNGEAEGYGLGRWEAYRFGSMCYYVRWFFEGGNRVEKKCFGHEVRDGQIMKSVWQSGQWYLFRANKLDEAAESANFSSGDQVSAIVNTIRDRLQSRK